MSYFFSPATQLFYNAAIHAQLPADKRPVTDEAYRQLVNERPAGKRVAPNEDGDPVLVDIEQPPITADGLCSLIDRAADAARHAVAGDPLRAEEYKTAAAEAKQFAAAGYPVDAVPPMVAAWAINGRTANQAADNILAEAAQYNAALVQLRTVRLAAKEQVRALMGGGADTEAQQLAIATVAAIQAAVAGIGNAGAQA